MAAAYFRVMVTGSRRWKDVMAIFRALEFAAESGLELGLPVELIHGAEPNGADRIAAEIGHQMGFKVTPYRADWQRLGLAAGPIRNQAMVDSRPELVLAFPDRLSKGTLDAMRKAIAAGIRVWQPQGSYRLAPLPEP